MTDEERFFFDLNGWLVRPAILTPEEIAAIADQVTRLHTDPASLPPEHRAVCSGPSAVLIDHPRIVDVIHEVVDPIPRLEASFSAFRHVGQGEQELHGGRVNSDPIFRYQVEDRRIYAGLVRVVIELTAVTEDDGATAFVPGSHKMNFPYPGAHGTSIEGPLAPLVRSYSCPAGSAIFFTENIVHGGQAWRRPEPRLAILSLYNHVASNTTRWSMPPEVFDALPLEKRAWYRPVWKGDFYSSPPRINTADTFLADPEPPLNYPRRVPAAAE